MTGSDIEYWFESFPTQLGEYFDECFYDAFVGHIFYGDDEDVVCVIIVCHKIMMLPI